MLFSLVAVDVLDAKHAFNVGYTSSGIGEHSARRRAVTCVTEWCAVRAGILIRISAHANKNRGFVARGSFDLPRFRRKKAKRMGHPE
jgi:hypothetical protein